MFLNLIVFCGENEVFFVGLSFVSGIKSVIKEVVNVDCGIEIDGLIDRLIGRL